MPTSRNGGKSLSSHGLPRWSYWSRRVFLSPVLLSSDEVFCVSWYRTGLENWRKTWKTHGGVEAGAPIRFDNRCRTANNLAPIALQCVFLPARRQPRPGRVGATLERPFCSSSFFLHHADEYLAQDPQRSTSYPVWVYVSKTLKTLVETCSNLWMT
ncbi:hypothetical protein F4823DRAFT_352968 [Ustulina deusta]|nr:hypothetical protein F4823DRAFT_352968 [Ustulina deusta]